MTLRDAALLGGLLLLAAGCASPPALAQTETPAASPWPPTEPAATHRAATAIGPAGVEIDDTLSTSVKSAAGVTLDLPEVSHGEGCLRIRMAFRGLRLPNVAVDESVPVMLTSEPRVFYAGTRLALAPRGGGGGGGQNPDGTFDLGQERIYDVAPALPSGPAIPLIVELSLDEALGFGPRLRFSVQSAPDATPRCGLQGLTTP
jgi:hypothetical protein